MWNRRDFVVMSAVAAATFGVTLAAVYPRLANAVNRAPAATVEVKTPALEVGTARVTASRDETDPQTINFTIANAGDKTTKVEFLAQILEAPSVPEGARSTPVPQPIWGQELSSTLKGGETKTIAVKLPASLFETPSVAAQKPVIAKANDANAKAANAPAVNSKTAVANGANAKGAQNARPVTPPMRYLTLADKAQPKRTITAMNFAPPAAVPQVAIANIIVAR